MNVRLLVGSHGSFRCVGKNEKARGGPASYQTSVLLSSNFLHIENY